MLLMWMGHHISASAQNTLASQTATAHSEGNVMIIIFDSNINFLVHTDRKIQTGTRDRNLLRFFTLFIYFYIYTCMCYLWVDLVWQRIYSLRPKKE